GPPGTGKSHLATALGVEAVKAGRSVYFASLADIISALAKAEREGQLRERIRFLCRTSLLIVDEIGYLPVIPGGGNLFFQLVNTRYERAAMILTSNRGFAEWGEVFGDPVVATALLDRLLHHAVVIQIEGSSYRLRQHADLMPEHVRSKPIINSPIPAQRRAVAGAHAKMELLITRPADHRNLRLGNFTSAQVRKIETARERRAIKWQLVPEHHFPTEVLEIRVLHPSLAQRLVGEVVHMLENEQPGHQPSRQGRLPTSHPTHPAEAPRQKVPIDLPP